MSSILNVYVNPFLFYFVDTQRCSPGGRTQRSGSVCWGDIKVISLSSLLALSLSLDDAFQFAI